MRISSLSVTRDRPGYARWLIWNMEKQTRPADETIILASGSSIDGDFSSESLKPKVIYSERPVITSNARQAVMESATGDVILWYDDDDWYHGDKNEILESGLQDSEYLGSAIFPPYWWHLGDSLLELPSPKLRSPFPGRGGVTYYPEQPFLPLFALRREVAMRYSWEPSVYRGSDTTWMRKIIADLGWGQISCTDLHPAMLILVHDQNVSQNSRESYKRGLVEVPEESPSWWGDLGQPEWEEIKRRVKDLRP